MCDLLFWEPAPSSTLKAEFSGDGDDNGGGGEGCETTEGWDDVLESEDEGDGSGMDTEIWCILAASGSNYLVLHRLPLYHKNMYFLKISLAKAMALAKPVMRS